MPWWRRPSHRPLPIIVAVIAVLAMAVTRCAAAHLSRAVNINRGNLHPHHLHTPHSRALTQFLAPPPPPHVRASLSVSASVRSGSSTATARARTRTRTREHSVPWGLGVIDNRRLLMMMSHGGSSSGSSSSGRGEGEGEHDMHGALHGMGGLGGLHGDQGQGDGDGEQHHVDLHHVIAPWRTHPYTPGTLYPVYPRAAVSITIVARPSAFDKPNDAKYLLVKRTKDPGAGKWSLPGGSVELGEDLLQSAAREAMEETGLSKEDLRFYHESVATTDAIYKDEAPANTNTSTKDKEVSPEPRVRFHYVISHMAAWVNSGAIARAKAGDDAADIKWVTVEELKREANRGVLVGSVVEVVFRVEKMLRTGMINLDRDLVTLP